MDRYRLLILARLRTTCYFLVLSLELGRDERFRCLVLRTPANRPLGSWTTCYFLVLSLELWRGKRFGCLVLRTPENRTRGRCWVMSCHILYHFM